jgi:hypothetical protein
LCKDDRNSERVADLLANHNAISAVGVVGTHGKGSSGTVGTRGDQYDAGRMGYNRVLIECATILLENDCLQTVRLLGEDDLTIILFFLMHRVQSSAMGKILVSNWCRGAQAGTSVVHWLGHCIELGPNKHCMAAILEFILSLSPDNPRDSLDHRHCTGEADRILTDFNSGWTLELCKLAVQSQDAHLIGLVRRVGRLMHRPLCNQIAQLTSFGYTAHLSSLRSVSSVVLSPVIAGSTRSMGSAVGVYRLASRL